MVVVMRMASALLTRDSKKLIADSSLSFKATTLCCRRESSPRTFKLCWAIRPKAYPSNHCILPRNLSACFGSIRFASIMASKASQSSCRRSVVWPIVKGPVAQPNRITSPRDLTWSLKLTAFVPSLANHIPKRSNKASAAMPVPWLIRFLQMTV